MSEATYSSARRLLVNYTEVTDLVPASDIKLGFSREPDSFPCITIIQIGGDSYGYLGYNSSPGGSKQRRENRLIQIDIYERDSILDLELISDKVEVALMSGSAFRKIGDIDMYEDGLDAYRKTQTWSFWDMVDD